MHSSCKYSILNLIKEQYSSAHILEEIMAKKSMFDIGTLLAGAVGAVAGAVGMFLSDEDNRKKVGNEVRHVEKVIEKDIRKAGSKIKKVTKTKKSKAKKRR